MVQARELAALASQIQDDADRVGAGPPQVGRAETAARDLGDPIVLYDILVTSPALRSASRQLFVDGHFARAVEEAFKCVNNTVKRRSGLTVDGQDLMNQAFSEKNPVLKLNDLSTESERSEQGGYMLIFGGVMRGIRNPRAHEHLLRDEMKPALEMLVLANHLMQIAERAKRSRRKK